jgi:hypothetical protein
MTVSTVLLALLCIATGIFFAGTVNSWVRPAADAVVKGLQTALGPLGF